MPQESLRKLNIIQHENLAEVDIGGRLPRDKMAHTEMRRVYKIRRRSIDYQFSHSEYSFFHFR